MWPRSCIFCAMQGSVGNTWTPERVGVSEANTSWWKFAKLVLLVQGAMIRRSHPEKSLKNCRLQCTWHSLAMQGFDYSWGTKCDCWSHSFGTKQNLNHLCKLRLFRELFSQSAPSRFVFSHFGTILFDVMHLCAVYRFVRYEYVICKEFCNSQQSGLVKCYTSMQFATDVSCSSQWSSTIY